MVAIKLRLTLYYPQVFERKYKITTDDFCGCWKDKFQFTFIFSGRQKWRENNQSEQNC